MRTGLSLEPVVAGPLLVAREVGKVLALGKKG